MALPGAAYWQYFEQLDKITAAKTDVQIKKQLFLKMKTEKGVFYGQFRKRPDSRWRRGGRAN